jgi:hypothetical protein
MVWRASSRRLSSALGGLLVFTATNAMAEAPAEAAAPSEQVPEDPTAARADAETRARAAALFDEGSALFARAEYERAAESFLAADALVPTSEALQSAIAAARKAEAHLLVVQASARAMSRESQDPDLASRARAALAEAERHLAKVQVSCSPEPCVVFLDGEPLDETRLHVAPGSHELGAQRGTSRALSTSGAHTERFTALAGTEYLFALDAPMRDERATAPTSMSPTPEPRGREKEPLVGEDSRTREGLPPWAFYGAVGVTGVLTIVTVWSGLDTLGQRGDLPNRQSPSYEGARADVYDAAQRTDVLLAASVLAGVGTAALGTWWTNWGEEQSVQLGMSPLQSGAELRLRGRFN